MNKCFRTLSHNTVFHSYQGLHDWGRPCSGENPLCKRRHRNRSHRPSENGRITQSRWFAAQWDHSDGEDQMPIPGQLLNHLLMNGGAADIITLVAGLLRGETLVKVSCITTSFSTSSLTLAMLSRNVMIAPFIHDTELRLSCPTMSPTARTASFTEHCTAGLSLTVWWLVSLSNSAGAVVNNRHHSKLMLHPLTYKT